MSFPSRGPGNLGAHFSIALLPSTMFLANHECNPPTVQSDMLIELFATPVAPGRSRFFTPAVPPPPGAKRPPMPPLKQLNLKRIASIASFM